jgi:DNA polymerase-1
LEDRISALTTKDRNKLAVYIHHYDGHCLRAYSYFKDKMPDITSKLEGLEPDSKEYVEVINSIKSSHKDLRQMSKSPTFACTYAGTWRTLMQKCGFSEEEAKRIEKAYHELYKESDNWVADKIKLASQNGYVTCAFGLKVRTPLLYQVLRGTSKTPFEAEAEGRTAGNALGQSWCLLTNRAGNEFNSKVRESPYRLDILPVAQIHDAQYFLIRNTPDVVLWANENLVKAVQWQDDPAIYHDQVKLGGEFSVFYPDWAHELVIPNKCTKEELLKLVADYEEKLNGN